MRGDYLADLTFSQFGNRDIRFQNLSSYGYQAMNDILLNVYLEIINNARLEKLYQFDDLFYGIDEISKRK